METNNYKGRPVGAVNKVNKQVKEVIADLVTINQPKFQSWFDELEPIDKINTYLKLLPYVTPKLRSVELIEEKKEDETDLSNWSDEDLDIVVRIHNKYEEI